MKKYKKIIYVFFIIVIASLGILLYKNISKGNSEDIKEKTLAEVEFLEKKIVTLLNDLNNIESRNYNLSVSEISKEDTSKSGESSQEEGSESSKEEGSQGESSGEDNQGQQNSDSSASNGEEEKSEEYTLKETGVLTNTNEIDWENIKTEVENLYSPIPTITLDLYGLDIAKEDILGFNQELDNLTKIVQEQNKENTLASLSKLYEYIPKFAEKTTDEKTYKTVIATKNNLFKAYSKLDTKNWGDISNDVKTSIETFSSGLVSTSSSSNKQYIINKIYIMLNELQNAVNVQDEAIFLIKYKNILEEMNNL